MTLSEKQRKHLRTLGHGLKPVVMVGANGLTEAVLKELEQSIEHHELMKIRISVGDREARDRVIDEILARTGVQLVQRIGNIALLFRARPKGSRIQFPA